MKFTIVDLFEVQFGGAKEAIDGDGEEYEMEIVVVG